jgi:hypothetical protein
MYSFCAMYSLRMSFCSVPPTCADVDPLLLRHRQVHREEDRRRRVDGHRGRHLAEGDAVEEGLHVGQRVDRHAALAHLAADISWSES